MRHDSFTHDMAHAYGFILRWHVLHPKAVYTVWRDSFTCTFSHDSSISWTWLIHTWHGSFIRIYSMTTRVSHPSSVQTHTHLWHDSFTCTNSHSSSISGKRLIHTRYGSLIWIHSMTTRFTTPNSVNTNSYVNDSFTSTYSHDLFGMIWYVWHDPYVWHVLQPTLSLEEHTIIFVTWLRCVTRLIRVTWLTCVTWLTYVTWLICVTWIKCLTWLICVTWLIFVTCTPAHTESGREPIL